MLHLTVTIDYSKLGLFGQVTGIRRSWKTAAGRNFRILIIVLGDVLQASKFRVLKTCEEA